MGGERLCSGVDDPVELDVPDSTRAGVRPGTEYAEERFQSPIDISGDASLPYADRDGLLLERQAEGRGRLAGDAKEKRNLSSPVRQLLMRI